MNDTHNRGGPAFPATSWTRDGEFLGDNQGMTLRDYFAAKAMRIAYDHYSRDLGSKKQDGHCFVWDDLHSDREGMCSIVAEASYAMADAMLKARQA